ncbi:GAP family protein [Blastococcus sp. SYSU D01042]
MSAELLAGIAGLALLDALNPATIAGVALILLAPLRRPVLTAAAFVLGAYGVVGVVGIAVYVGADAAAQALSAGLDWLRRGAFGLAAVALAVSGLRRFRDRERGAVTLPGWVGPWTAVPLGVLMTGADLPNAFPYLIAIERLVAADAGHGPAIAVLLAYGVVYCLPCLVLLLVAAARGDRVRRRLGRVYERIGRARTVRRSIPAALLLSAAAVGVATVAVSA